MSSSSIHYRVLSYYCRYCSPRNAPHNTLHLMDVSAVNTAMASNRGSQAVYSQILRISFNPPTARTVCLLRVLSFQDFDIIKLGSSQDFQPFIVHQSIGLAIIYSFYYLLPALASFVISCTAVDPSPANSQNIGNSEPKTHGVSERSDDTTKRKYIIVPKNPTDDDTNRKTEEFLKSITKQTSIFSAKSSTYGLIWWLANATNVEADTIKKNSGQ